MKNKMESVNFWDFSDEAKISLYKEIKEKKNVSPKAAEKDWWVSHVIRAVFSLECADALTFKGGTSLSKAWGITERFSEDIDISIDKSFFGLSGDTRSARDRIRKLSRKYIYETVRDEIAGLIYVYGGDKFAVDYKTRNDSDADPTVLLVPYYSLLPADPYIKEVVKIEFSCRNLREPREPRRIVPFAAELSPVIDFPETIVPTVTPVRTFMEKVFLLHENLLKDHPRYKRMSRHLYDLYRLDKAGYTYKAVSDTDLYKTIVGHRSVFNTIRGIDYGSHAPASLNIIPPKELLPLWESDYKSMQEQFIYGESPAFNDLMSSIEAIQQRFRSIVL